MKLDALERELAQGTIRPVYLAVGEEPLLRDDALAAIRRAALDGSADDWNFDRLDGESTAPGDLLDALRTLPILAPRRLVVLREPDAGRGRAKGLADALAEVVPELAGGSAVLVVSAGRVDRRTRWVRAVDDEAVIACDPPRTRRDTAAWVRAEAGRQGVELERGVPELLAERVGPQLLMLRQEIAKLALVAGPGRPVARAHVEAGACDVAEEPIWDLTDAIGEGRGGDALSVLARLLRAGAPAPVVLGALASHFRRLARVAGGAPPPVPPFVRKKLEGQARRYARGRLLACLRAIHETDLALKGAGALRPELALERLVLGLSA